ncbi:hypothetical protein BDZ89DRAFT_1132765 [Hymenopellis radicata]|nr:hypothetical protein BDZ89DRAFT_1132765 [Hymenopellis radicata]
MSTTQSTTTASPSQNPAPARGDHGGENITVAQAVQSGALLWGRSTQNMRIEQLWAAVHESTETDSEEHPNE